MSVEEISIKLVIAVYFLMGAIAITYDFNCARGRALNGLKPAFPICRHLLYAFVLGCLGALFFGILGCAVGMSIGTILFCADDKYVLNLRRANRKPIQKGARRVTE